MTTTQPGIKTLSTGQLGQHLAAICDELAVRHDHDPTDLVRTMERLGRSLGELGSCLGKPSSGPARWANAPLASRTCPSTHHRPASMVEPSARLCDVDLTLTGVQEAKPGLAWKSLFEKTWPSYRRWYGSEGWERRPSLSESSAALTKHMPELLPVWRHLVELSGDDADAARMLSLWNPPAFAPGCSQLVVPGPSRALIRNYDYDPALFEGLSVSSHWRKRAVLGTSDCLWGLLDGMNDQGLGVSLTFGGVPGTGNGFAIPLVVRYLLEMCDTVTQARRVLDRLPVAATYNLTLTDRSGVVTTAFVAPDRRPEYFDMPLATNHRGLVPDRPDLARRLRSVERQDVLRELQRSAADADVTVDAFLSPSLRSLDFESGFGTLYTADYRPEEGQMTYHWPDVTWRRSFSSPHDEVTVRLR